MGRGTATSTSTSTSPSTEARTEGGGAGGADPDLELAARLRLVLMRLSRRLRQETGGVITPSQVSALSSVERLGPLSLGDLAATEQVQPPSMTRIVAHLEEAGLVARETDERDRRVARVRVTAEGRRALQRSRGRKNAYLARHLARLDAAERRDLDHAVALLERVIEEAR